MLMSVQYSFCCTIKTTDSLPLFLFLSSCRTRMRFSRFYNKSDTTTTTTTIAIIILSFFSYLVEYHSNCIFLQEKQGKRTCFRLPVGNEKPKKRRKIITIRLGDGLMSIIVLTDGNRWKKTLVARLCGETVKVYCVCTQLRLFDVYLCTYHYAHDLF